MASAVFDLATLGHDLCGPLAVIEASRSVLERPDASEERHLGVDPAHPPLGPDDGGAHH